MIMPPWLALLVDPHPSRDGGRRLLDSARAKRSEFSLPLRHVLFGIYGKKGIGEFSRVFPVLLRDS
jgi:hypothetical protein